MEKLSKKEFINRMIEYIIHKKDLFTVSYEYFNGTEKNNVVIEETEVKDALKRKDIKRIEFEINKKGLKYFGEEGNTNFILRKFNTDDTFDFYGTRIGKYSDEMIHRWFRKTEITERYMAYFGYILKNKNKFLIKESDAPTMDEPVELEDYNELLNGRWDFYHKPTKITLSTERDIDGRMNIFKEVKRDKYTYKLVSIPNSPIELFR